MKQMFLTALVTVFSASLALAAGNATEGKPVYDKACKSCHGATGAANPAIAKMMKVDMKDLGSGEVQGLSDEALKKVITEGERKMKPVKTVTGKDADGVIAYVRSFKK
jgi:predicted CXXCH cytochrome family protein